MEATVEQLGGPVPGLHLFHSSRRPKYHFPMVGLSKIVFMSTLALSVVLWVGGTVIQNKLAVDPKSAASVAKLIAMTLTAVLAFSALPLTVDWFFKAQKKMGNVDAIPLLGRLESQQNLIVFVIWAIWAIGLAIALVYSKR